MQCGCNLGAEFALCRNGHVWAIGFRYKQQLYSVHLNKFWCMKVLSSWWVLGTEDNQLHPSPSNIPANVWHYVKNEAVCVSSSLPVGHDGSVKPVTSGTTIRRHFS